MHFIPERADQQLTSGLTIAELIRERMGEFTAGERNVARALLADYPNAALGSLAELASRAEVSDPTAMRFAVKLGFDGFPHLQLVLREEVRARLSSPLNVYERQAAQFENSPDPIQQVIPELIRNLEHSTANLASADWERALALIGDKRRNVYCLGHRFSHAAAYYLHFHLHQLRPRVTLLETGIQFPADALIDIGRRDVVVVFDYRRYHPATHAFATAAAGYGASIVLFTDGWLSPVARLADAVLPIGIESASPCDSLTAVIAMIDALLAGLVRDLGASVPERMKKIEEARATIAQSTTAGPPDAVSARSRAGGRQNT